MTMLPEIDNPLAAVPDPELERRYEQQNKGLSQAIRDGDKIRAVRLQAAMSATEAELKRRGLHAGHVDPIRFPQHSD